MTTHSWATHSWATLLMSGSLNESFLSTHMSHRLIDSLATHLLKSHRLFDWDFVHTTEQWLSLILFRLKTTIGVRGWGGDRLQSKMAAGFVPYTPTQLMWAWETKKNTIFVCTFYGAVSRNRLQSKMALGLFPYTPTQPMWAWETQINHHLCMYFLWGSFCKSRAGQNGGRVFPVYAYTAYVGVGNSN